MEINVRSDSEWEMDGTRQLTGDTAGWLSGLQNHELWVQICPDGCHAVRHKGTVNVCGD